MRWIVPLSLALAALTVASTAPTAAQDSLDVLSGGNRLTLAARTSDDLRTVEPRVADWIRSRELVMSDSHEDALVPGRRHETFQQFHRGIRVHGGGISRQMSGDTTVSVFGTILPVADTETTPRLSADDAAAVVRLASGARSNWSWPRRRSRRRGGGLAALRHAYCCSSRTRCATANAAFAAGTPQ